MEDRIQISEDRLRVMEKISLYESYGGEYTFMDVEDDPPAKTLAPNDVDYLKTKLKSKILNLICRRKVAKMLKAFALERQISVVGSENLLKVDGGAVLTTNHFHPFDSAPVIYAIEKYLKKKKIHIVIREGNYQIPGLFGFLLKNYDTFPLSSNMKTTINLNKAIDTVLGAGDLLLVYPEQSMWYNYKKPRGYRVGAYRWASRNFVPVIPCFTVMEDLEDFEPNGLKKQKLTLFIGEPIFPDANLSEKQNAQIMLNKNRDFTISTYESFYGERYDLATTND